MQDLIAVGGWIGPTIAIILCGLAVLIALGWSLNRERERDDKIDRWLSGDDERDPPP